MRSAIAYPTISQVNTSLTPARYSRAERVPGSNYLAKYAVAFLGYSAPYVSRPVPCAMGRLSASRSDAERVPGADMWLEDLALAIQLTSLSAVSSDRDCLNNGQEHIGYGKPATFRNHTEDGLAL